MKVATALIAVGAFLVFNSVIFVTTYGCTTGDCGPSMNEISFWIGAGLFGLGLARGAFVTVRSAQRAYQRSPER